MIVPISHLVIAGLCVLFAPFIQAACILFVDFVARILSGGR